MQIQESLINPAPPGSGNFGITAVELLLPFNRLLFTSYLVSYGAL